MKKVLLVSSLLMTLLASCMSAEVPLVCENLIGMDYDACVKYPEPYQDIHGRKLNQAIVAVRAAEPTATPFYTSARSSTTMTTNSGPFCGIVVSGDGVRDAIVRANRGMFPSSVVAGLEMLVGIYHLDGSKEIITLTKAMEHPYPTIYVGDIVCVCVKRVLLDAYIP